MPQRKKNKKTKWFYFQVINLSLVFSCIILFGLSINAEEASANPSAVIPTAPSIPETATPPVNQDTSPFWLNLRPKILEYLNKNINANIFKYELVGPTMPMKKFIGNVPNAVVTISGFNPNSKSDMQTIIAKAANGEVISIHIKLAKYRNILISKKNHEPNEVLSTANFQSEKRTIPLVS